MKLLAIILILLALNIRVGVQFHLMEVVSTVWCLHFTKILYEKFLFSCFILLFPAYVNTLDSSEAKQKSINVFTINNNYCWNFFPSFSFLVHSVFRYVSQKLHISSHDSENLFYVMGALFHFYSFLSAFSFHFSLFECLKTMRDFFLLREKEKRVFTY